MLEVMCAGTRVILETVAKRSLKAWVTACKRLIFFGGALRHIMNETHRLPDGKDNLF